MRFAEQGMTRYSQVLHRGPVLVEREVGHLGHLPGPPHWALRPAKESPHPRHGGQKAPCSCRSTCTLARRLHLLPPLLLCCPLALRPNNFSGNVSSRNKKTKQFKNVSERERTDATSERDGDGGRRGRGDRGRGCGGGHGGGGMPIPEGLEGQREVHSFAGAHPFAGGQLECRHRVRARGVPRGT